MLTPEPEGQSNEQSIDTVVAPGNWYHTILQNGKQVEVIHGMVSRDGKTMQQITKGIDAQGKAYEAVGVYEKK